MKRHRTSRQCRSQEPISPGSAEAGSPPHDAGLHGKRCMRRYADLALEQCLAKVIANASSFGSGRRALSTLAVRAST